MSNFPTIRLFLFFDLFRETDEFLEMFQGKRLIFGENSYIMVTKDDFYPHDFHLAFILFEEGTK